MVKRSIADTLGAMGVMVIVAAVSPASGTTITVDNFSFETLPAGGLPNGCGAGCSFSVGDIPNWIRSPADPILSGQLQPGSSGALFNTVPDGITVAYSNGGDLLQTVGVSAQAGATYTLQVDMGFRKDIGAEGVIGLKIGANTYFGIGIADPFSGNWVTYTAIHTATALENGAAITIVLHAPGAIANTQSDFDNVRLSYDAAAAAVPLPATLPLFATGLGLLGLLGRRRKRKEAAANA